MMLWLRFRNIHLLKVKLRFIDNLEKGRENENGIKIKILIIKYNKK
jgi:hypothetical protein